MAIRIDWLQAELGKNMHDQCCLGLLSKFVRQQKQTDVQLNL